MDSAMKPASDTVMSVARRAAARTAVAGLIALTVLAGSARAAEADDELSKKATDPTASLISFSLNDWYSGQHGSDDRLNQVVLRAVLPFSVAGTHHIFRVTQPFVTSSPGRTGAGDMTVFDLMVFGEPWGRWGVGLAGLLPTGTDGLSVEKWSVGPSVGFVNSSLKTQSFGLFVQSYVSVAGDAAAPDVGVVNLQPIFSHQLGGGRSISLGNSQLVYDTERSRWASLQLGLNYGQVVGAWGHKWRPSIEGDYDFRRLAGNPAWTVRLGLTLLVPN